MGSYSRILRVPRMRSLLLTALVARLPIGINGLAVVLLLQEQRGSFGIAGLASGALALGNGLGTPLMARVVDRTGSGVLGVLALGHAAGLVALLVLAADDREAVDADRQPRHQGGEQQRPHARHAQDPRVRAHAGPSYMRVQRGVSALLRGGTTLGCPGGPVLRGSRSYAAVRPTRQPAHRAHSGGPRARPPGARGQARRPRGGDASRRRRAGARARARRAAAPARGAGRLGAGAGARAG